MGLVDNPSEVSEHICIHNLRPNQERLRKQNTIGPAISIWIVTHYPLCEKTL
jgi:hypothetical protein